MSGSSSLIVQIQIAIVGVMIVLGAFFMWRAITSLTERVNKLENNAVAAAMCCPIPGGCPGAGGPSILSAVSGGGRTGSTETTGSWNTYAQQAQQAQQAQADAEYAEDGAEADANANADADADADYEEGVDTYYGEEDPVGDALHQDGLDVIEDAMRQVFENIHIPSNAVIFQTKYVEEPEVVSPSPRITDITDDARSDASTVNPLSKSKLNKMNAERLRELCGERAVPTEGTKAQLVDRLLGIVRD